MKVLSILGEGWRNLASGTTRAVFLAAAFVVTVGALAVLDVRSEVEILQAAVRFRDAGGAVHVMEGGVVSGQRCEAITGVEGVKAAGATRPGSSLSLYAMPGAVIKVIETTPGLIEMLPTIAKPVSTHSGGTSGVWLSADLAAALGAGPGDGVATSAGIAVVAGTYTWPSDGRSRELGYSILAPVAADGQFAQCLALVWPPGQDGAGLLHTVAIPGSGGEPSVGQLNPALGSTFNATEMLAGRLTSGAPWAGAMIGFALGFIAVWGRRVELASALHARVRKPHLAWQLLLETVAWVCLASVVTVAALLWAARAGNPDASLATWLTGLRTVVAASGTSIVGGLVAVALIKEKHFFRYSKDR